MLFFCKRLMSRAEHKLKSFKSFGMAKVFGPSVRANLLVLQSFFSPSFTGKVIRFLFDTNGRVLSLFMDIDSFMLNLVNTYSPNSASDRNLFSSGLNDFFIARCGLLIGGDFNCIDSTIGKFNCLSVLPIERLHMTSRQPYWCSKTMKRRPCWCTKPVLWELNSFLIETLSFVSVNLHVSWPRE